MIHYLIDLVGWLALLDAPVELIAGRFGRVKRGCRWNVLWGLQASSERKMTER
jgi:hypothetical protein